MLDAELSLCQKAGLCCDALDEHLSRSANASKVKSFRVDAADHRQIQPSRHCQKKDRAHNAEPRSSSSAMQAISLHQAIDWTCNSPHFMQRLIAYLVEMSPPSEEASLHHIGCHAGRFLVSIGDAMSHGVTQRCRSNSADGILDEPVINPRLTPKGGAS